MPELIHTYFRPSSQNLSCLLVLGCGICMHATYSPAACRLGRSGLDFCLLYPFTWIIKSAARRWSPQRAGARLLVRVNYWSEAQLRWRLRDRGGPRRERAACRLEEAPAKAISYAVWKCKGKGDGGCRQASEKAALAAKAHLDKTVLSATSSTS